MLNPEIKDWQIAQLMFGRNTKTECRIAKSLRSNVEIMQICDEYSIVRDTETDDCGWIIPNECLI